MWKEFQDLSRKAVGCRVCFERGWVRPALIDVAQPRWVGPRYEAAHPRVLIILLNPGSGATRDGVADTAFRTHLRAFRDDAGPLEAALDHQGSDMWNWGRPPGRFLDFYLEGLGLVFSEVAFANIAWCSSADNEYPREMLDTCFGRNTEDLISVLKPHRIVLSGTDAWKFEERIADKHPSATIVKILHYAHRKGRAAERENLEQARLGIHGDV